MGEPLAVEAVVPRLRGRFGSPYRFVARCPSTQRLLGEDAPEGAVVVADEQTEGRGRLGRRWEAAASTSLLLSLRLLPAVPAEHLPELPPLAARAVAEALEAVCGVRANVKPPNDVLVAGRKVAGVLGEASEGRVTLGIGVNVNQREEELPQETRLPATSLRIETGREVDRAELLVALLEQLETAYDAWNTKS